MKTLEKNTFVRKILVIVVFFTSLVLISESAFSIGTVEEPHVGVPYKGPGGKIETLKVIERAFSFNLVMFEVCKRFPSVEDTRKSLEKSYFLKNMTELLKIRERMWQLAKNNGGQKEETRLQDEIESWDEAGLRELMREAQMRVTTVQQCSKFFGLVSSGSLDLKVSHINQINLILK